MNTIKTMVASLSIIAIAFIWSGCEKEPDPVNNTPTPSTGTPYTLVKIGGDNQTDTVSSLLSTNLKVQVQDSLGAAFVGETVTFAVSTGGGSLSATSVTTDANGFAESSWTLGSTEGTQTVSVTASVVNGSPLTFTASAIPAATGGANTCTSSFTDPRDGEVYCQVTIGSQTWMAQNLRYNTAASYYNATWNPSTDYGRLYTWSDLMNGGTSSSANPSGVQGLCPSGWHLPSDAEWNELEMSLGMAASDATAIGYRGTHGHDIKSLGDWNFFGNGLNTSGFTAWPAGVWRPADQFIGIGSAAYFWTTTENSSTQAWNRGLFFQYQGVEREPNDKTHALSCRCVKD